MKYFLRRVTTARSFPTQDKLFGFDQFMQFIMQYGEQGAQSHRADDEGPEKNEAQSDLLEQLINEGLLDKGRPGEAQADARGASGGCSARALMEVFANLRQGQREGGMEKVHGPGQGGRADRRDESRINTATR